MLSMNYTSNINISYYCVMYLVLEIYYGWYLRYIHSLGSTLVFIITYYHSYKGLYILSYYFSHIIYITGTLLMIVLIIIAFLGYILTWGQMSFWGSTVILSIFICIPSLISLLIGDFHISIPTLYRFFIIHFIVPICNISLIFIHLYHIHISTTTNPIALICNNLVELFPYVVIKDILYLYYITT